ncbi:oligopeptide ABC transporter permease [Desmospora profundinema]|uniref:Peptide/nickel transport system permease protein n=1 Tax=Desmospora profundinema TaxID=1571184 RepID=A0ABU1ILC3_9BACL|nr:oligopeptide ABC transporter permease [Desmospora profundinema]MDR6225586.1 peptide/nickel transport system permease protein [Desmospora profundinema]
MNVVTHETALKSKPHQSLSPWALARKKFMRRKLAVLSALFLIFMIALSFLAPYVTTTDISRIHTDKISLEPSSEHWLGTDKNGRDVFTRTLYGGRVSLTIGLASTFFVTLIGTTIGAVAGYFGGWVDSLLMRLTDFMMNFPFMVFAIVLNSILLGKLTNAWSLVIVFSVLTWGSVARIVRSVILAEKENEYILAARSIGTKPGMIIIKHLLPNVMTTIIVQATLLLALYIVAEAGLSFIGIGVPTDTPSWGNMLMEARERDVLQNKPWIWVPPAICVSFTILAINFFGEGVKDAFNPKAH